MENSSPTLRPLISAGLLFGIGLGGFVDGIVLHQILQWHHMLTSGPAPLTSLENLQINTLWDGLFHAFTWVITAIAIAIFWGAASNPDVPWSGKAFVGSMSAGWGVFNLVEGTINHQILGIHHVNETVPPDQWMLWDIGFLLFGAALVGIGLFLITSARSEISDPDHRATAIGG